MCIKLKAESKSLNRRRGELNRMQVLQIVSIRGVPIHDSHSPVDDRGRVELEERGERHPDEEGGPADDEDAHDDAHGAGRRRLALSVLKQG